MEVALCIGLALGLETLADSSHLALFYNAFFAAVKEALWHAHAGFVRAADLRPKAISAGTGISWPCQVWYLTARLTLLRWKSPPPNSREPAPDPSSRGEDKMKVAERRQLTRLNLRTPLRFRALGVASDKTEHFTEALNVSRGGFFFASSAPLQVGMPIEATLRMPEEVTGNSAQEMRCTARVVHVRNEPYGDGRIGFGAEIEKFQTIPAQIGRAHV